MERKPDMDIERMASWRRVAVRLEFFAGHGEADGRWQASMRCEGGEGKQRPICECIASPGYKAVLVFPPMSGLSNGDTTA